MDAFFDHVFVMAEDEAVRQNRLALLRYEVAGIAPRFDVTCAIVDIQRSKPLASRLTKVADGLLVSRCNDRCLVLLHMLGCHSIMLRIVTCHASGCAGRLRSCRGAFATCQSFQVSNGAAW